jgi:DNA helicase-2/ATP-dependent DNA helicase PcrA
LSWLRFHRAILIGELVPEALRFLRNNPQCEERTAFDHVIVDEYQDLNKAEQVLVDLLTGGQAIAIVGDVDQSIYRFRHANPEGIQTFNVSHPGTHDEFLDECRRCPTRVVTIADHLIGHNYPEPSLRLRPCPGNPLGVIHIVQWDSIADEASGLAEYVRALVAGGVSPGEVLVLTPRRLLGYAIRDEIAAREIEVHSFYNEEALESDEAQRAYALLSLLADIEDRVALRWWLGEGSPSNRRNAYQRLRRHCEHANISPKAALDACIAGLLQLPNTTDLVEKYRELVQILNELQQLELSALINALMPEGNEAVAVIREVAILNLPEMETVSDLFGCIRNFVTQPEIPEKANYVRVMSLHKSKGLTSKVTIVSGCVQGLVPFVDSDAPPDEAQAIMREQRRLFYVAITRCTQTLVISSFTRIPRQLAWKIGARVVPGPGPNGRTVASQCLDEWGPGAPPSKRGTSWTQNGYTE